MAKRKVCVLGANSFSGQDFVDLLLDDPANEVLGVSRSPERSDLFLKYRLREHLGAYRYFAIDLNRDLDSLLALLDAERPTHLVNYAAQSEVAPSWDHPEDWFRTNCVALAKLVNHLRRRDYVERYLHVSSPEVYGTCVGRVFEDAPFNPSTPYAASKAGADLLLQTYARQFQFPVLWVRATNVYGARQQLFKIIPRSVIYLRMGKKIPLHGGGRAIKSYIHIRDVSRGMLTILGRGTPGQIYHLSPDAGVAVADVVGQICRLLNRSWDDSVEIVAERPGQDAAYVIDSTKAREQLGWTPQIGLASGLAEVVDWIDAYWNEIQRLPLEYQHRP